MSVLKIVLAVVLSALLCAPAASASTKLERTQARQIGILKRQKATLKTKLAATQREVVGLRVTVSGLNGTLTRVADENAGLRETLPEQVATIARRDNLTELRDLVLAPAYAAWACQGSFNFGTYDMRYTFNGRYSDGTCVGVL